MHKKHIRIAAILLGCLVIAAAATMFIKGEELKSLVVEQKSKQADVSPQAMPVTAPVYLAGGQIILTGEPALGARIEKEALPDIEIGKIKISNSGTEPISFDSVKFTDRGFATNAPVYELFVSEENSEKYEKTGSASAAPEFKLDSSVDVTAGAYRNISVRVKNARDLEKGNIFMLELKSLGSLNFGQNQKLSLGAVMLK